MDLKPLVLMDVDTLRLLPNVLYTQYSQEARGARSFNHVTMNNLENYIREMAELRPTVKRVALCTDRMFTVYKNELASEYTFSSIISMESFLRDPGETRHVLLKRDVTQLAEGFCTYASMTNTQPSSCESIRIMLNVNAATHSSRRKIRMQSILSIYDSFVDKHHDDHTVYLDWLAEYGVDI